MLKLMEANCAMLPAFLYARKYQGPGAGYAGRRSSQDMREKTGTWSADTLPGTARTKLAGALQKMVAVAVNGGKTALPTPGSGAGAGQENRSPGLMRKSQGRMPKAVQALEIRQVPEKSGAGTASLRYREFLCRRCPACRSTRPPPLFLYERKSVKTGELLCSREVQILRQNKNFPQSLPSGPASRTSVTSSWAARGPVREKSALKNPGCNTRMTIHSLALLKQICGTARGPGHHFVRYSLCRHHSSLNFLPFIKIMPSRRSCPARQHRPGICRIYTCRYAVKACSCSEKTRASRRSSCRPKCCSP